MAELRQKVDRVVTALADERAESWRRLEEAAKIWVELQQQQQEEKERASMVLQKLQSTYQGQLTHYREQEADTVLIIMQLKEER